MAIRRCPYCKAIIDEQDKYCNNCGTQLLFPEDEYVDEEIPGDRIVEEPEEEKKEAGEPEEREEPQELEAAEEELEEEEGKEEEEKVEDEEEENEEEEEEEREEEEKKDKDTDDLGEAVDEEEEEKETVEEFDFNAEGEEPEEEEDVEEIESPTGEIGTKEPTGKPAQVDESQGKYKVSIEEDVLVFKTKELEGLTDTVEEGKEKVKEFLSSFDREKAKSVTPDKIPALFPERDKTAPTTREILPPWAKVMKEEPARPDDFEGSKGKVTETESEPGTTPTRPDWATDSGIGIPEKITRAGLPFGTAAIPATAEVREAGAEEEEEARMEGRQKSRLPLKLRSKLVDLVFITALWVISLWFTAQVIGVSFFRLFVGSAVPVLAFYFILLLLYFFLFLYFLGETLGDHFFSEED
jgi:hypothetical protein